MRGYLARFFQTSPLGDVWRSWRDCCLGRTAILHGDHRNSGGLGGCSHCFYDRVCGSQTHSVKVVSAKWNRSATSSSRGPSSRPRVKPCGVNVLNATKASTTGTRFPADFSWNICNAPKSDQGLQAHHGWETAKHIGIPTIKSAPATSADSSTCPLAFLNRRENKDAFDIYLRANLSAGQDR